MAGSGSTGSHYNASDLVQAALSERYSMARQENRRRFTPKEQTEASAIEYARSACYGFERFVRRAPVDHKRWLDAPALVFGSSGQSHGLPRLRAAIRRVASAVCIGLVDGGLRGAHSRWCGGRVSCGYGRRAGAAWRRM